jgi:uncharacterized protein YwqG
MESINFVKKYIDYLIQIYPSILCVYKLNEFDNSHQIEIFPTNYLKGNYRLLRQINIICLAFIEKYPDEGIFFLNNGNNVDFIDYDYLNFGVSYLTTTKTNVYTNNVKLKGSILIGSLFVNKPIYSANDCLIQIDNYSLITADNNQLLAA